MQAWESAGVVRAGGQRSAQTTLSQNTHPAPPPPAAASLASHRVRRSSKTDLVGGGERRGVV